LATVSITWKYCATNPARHTRCRLTVQITQSSSAPRRMASSRFASVM
jgi:hypothetical protein